MGRHGKLFDQDAESEEPSSNPWGPAVHAGRGVLYDQDASMELPRLDPMQAARYQRELDRRRERERQLRRDAETAARRDADTESAREATRSDRQEQRADGPEARTEPRTEPRAAPAPHPSLPPVRITSRAAPLYPAGAPPQPPPPAPSPPAPEERQAHPPAPRPPATAPPPDANRPPAAEAPGTAAPGRPPASRPPVGRPPVDRPEANRPARQGPPRPANRPAEPAATSMGRATAILAFGTFASRLTGFVRVLVIGYVLGVGVLSDAFNYANGVPNIVYDLLLGGILSATLIPVFVEQLNEDDPGEASRSISAILTAISLALIGVSAFLYLAAPWVIRFYLVLSPGNTGGPEKALATRLLRYFSPQVFFLGAIVASTALLNARRRFTAAAVSPVLNNLVAIAALLTTKVVADNVLGHKGITPTATLDQFGRDARAVMILGLGTTAGYVVQLLVQLPAMHRLGLRLRPVWDLRHRAVRRVAALSSWLLGVVLANQASLALVMILAGRTAGGVTAYQFGYQFFQLPYALIAVSVASAIMPDLSERWSAGQRVAFERQFVTGLRVTLAVLIPVSLVYMAVAEPFIQLAIHHGAVGQSGAHLVTTTLVYFVAGLPGFSAFFLLMRAFQAMQDARTMFRVYVIENVLTVIAAPILSAVLGVPGLALAWVAPYTVASVYAVVLLRRRVGSLGGWLTIRALFRIVVASVVSGAVAAALGLPFPSGHGDAMLLLRLVVQVGGAAGVYFYLARALRIRELRPVLAIAGRLTRRA
ncbi:MAG TPA: murein biosynthesis integral membrane protein MurJ [Acidimicrobiales bacterium]|nr:murein biosynthesis integral membrane protein MurJ [Acidimicrobiales bacterium]